MDIEAVISGRRSTRAYERQVPDERLIRSLIEAAIQAPNAMNQQPWTFTVVRDPARLDQLSAAAKAHMLAMTGGAASGAHAGELRARLADPAFHIFYHAPVLILICGSAPGEWLVEDCALAAQNLMLRAYSLGLGSCWIGFAQRYLATPEGKQLLDLAPSWVPVAPIIVGYPSAPPPAVPRTLPEIRWID
jgi:nitroreductase